MGSLSRPPAVLAGGLDGKCRDDFSLNSIPLLRKDLDQCSCDILSAALILATYTANSVEMAPAMTTLPANEQSGALLESEKKIWMIVVPLSICIPCLAACIIYVARRYRAKKLQQPRPTSHDVPIEVHHQAWIEHMRRINQENQQDGPAPDETKIAMKDIHLHEFPSHARSQSNPQLPQYNTKPHHNDSPLRRQWQESDRASEKNVFQSTLPQELHPAMRRGSAY